MRAWMTPLAAGLQLAVLAFMAGEREAVLAYGKQVWLKTAPVDPQDLFRGDYVRLSYDASSIPKERWRGPLAETGTARNGERVYALMAPGQDGLWQVQALTDAPPDAGTYLRGRVLHCSPTAMDVRYGIEAYFMQQGTALTLEQQRNRQGIQVPLEMDVAVGRTGIAVLRGYRSGPLGLGLDLETRTAADGRREFTGLVTLRLLNASDRPLAVVDLPAAGAFRLRPEPQWQPNPWCWVNRDRAMPPVTDADVKVLAPGAIHTVHVDLKDPAWFIEVPGKPERRTVKGLEAWNCWFRLVYETPPAEACSGLTDARIIWHGSMPSRRFNGMQRVD